MEYHCNPYYLREQLDVPDKVIVWVFRFTLIWVCKESEVNFTDSNTHTQHTHTPSSITLIASIQWGTKSLREEIASTYTLYMYIHTVRGVSTEALR